jgi:hypothetical protein
MRPAARRLRMAGRVRFVGHRRVTARNAGGGHLGSLASAAGLVHGSVRAAGGGGGPFRPDSSNGGPSDAMRPEQWLAVTCPRSPPRAGEGAAQANGNLGRNGQWRSIGSVRVALVLRAVPAGQSRGRQDECQSGWTLMAKASHARMLTHPKLTPRATVAAALRLPAPWARYVFRTRAGPFAS